MCEPFRYFASAILVDAMKSHQGIELQQSGPKPPGRFPEPPAIPIAIDSEHGRGDRVHVHLVEIGTTMPGHPLDTLAHHQARVLGQVD
jgi:hypothetical protein